MKNKIISFFIAALTGFLLSDAQTFQPELVELDSMATAKFVADITADYHDWRTISYSGKLSGGGLPLKPSVKIYMEKGNLTIISLSAPIVGEVGRVEIDNENALIVNKYNNTYTIIPIAECDRFCPGGSSALQNLLLGRISLMGKGQLTAADSNDVVVYDAMIYDVVVPINDYQPCDYTYFYTLDPSTLLLSNFLIVSEENESNAGQCAYSYDKDGTTLSFNISLGGKFLEASLQLNKPDLNTKKIERIELSSKYKKVAPEKIL